MNTIKKIGKFFFSMETGRLHDSIEEAEFESRRTQIRKKLRENGVSQSWEWLFLPFLNEEWISSWEKEIIDFLKELGVPLKKGGIRIIPHDKYGVHGPSQNQMLAHIIAILKNSYYVNSEFLNGLGRDAKYIRAEGTAPEFYNSGIMDFAEIRISQLYAEGTAFETNLSFDEERLQELEFYFSDCEVRDSRISVFGNTSDPSLVISKCGLGGGFQPPKFGVMNVSRTFLRTFCKKYASQGEAEYVSFTSH